MYKADVVMLKKLLTLREGRAEHVYSDHLGYHTAGIGHLLTKSEESLYKLGDAVPASIVDDWFEKDVERFLKRTEIQLADLGIIQGYLEFCTCLVSVNFQLGNFKVKFPNTFEAIRAGRYSDAIQAVERSLWAEQTPVRVQDFVMAIRTMDPATARIGRDYFSDILR